MGVQTVVFGQAWVDSIDIARKYYKSEQYSKAKTTYEYLEQNIKKEINLKNELAQTHYRIQDYSQAITYYEKSLAESKTVSDKSKIWHNLGNAKFKLNNIEGAISAFKMSLRLDPQNEETRYNLSEALRKKNKKEDPPQDKKPEDKKPEDKKKDPNENPSDRPKNIPNKKVDKILDDLAKKELETKRKLNRTKSQSRSREQQDW